MKNRKFDVMTLSPCKTKILSPEEMVKMDLTQSKNIEKIEFIMPKIGKSGFGRFKVTFKNPMFSEF